MAQVILLDKNSKALGVLKTCTSAPVTQELNARYTCEVTISKSDELASEFIGDAIVSLKDADGSDQFFVLQQPKESLTEITAFGWHVSQDLADDLILNRAWLDKTGAEVWPELIQSGISERRFSGISDITTVSSIRIVRSNILSACIGDQNNSFVNRFGGELQRNNFTVNMLSRVGSDKGFRAVLGKNILGIEIDKDFSQIIYRVVPTFLNSNNSAMLLPEIYIDSPFISGKRTTKTIPIHYSDIKIGEEIEGVINYPTKADAETEVRNRVAKLWTQGADQPIITARIDLVLLRDTDQYADLAQLEDVELGDTVTTMIENNTFTERVVGYVYDSLNERFNEVTLGTLERSLDSIYAEIQTVTDEVDSLVDRTYRFNQTMLESRAEMNRMISNAAGFHSTTITNADGSEKVYFHDQPTLEASQKIEFYPEPGSRVYTNTGWNSGDPVWIYGTVDGSLIANVISAVRLNAENIFIGEDSLPNILEQQTSEQTAYADQLRLEAEEASNDYTVAQMELEKVRTDAYADNVLSLAEAEALSQAETAVEESKSYVDQRESAIRAFTETLVADEMEEVRTYIRTDSSGNLLIGKAGNPIVLRQTNDRISFLHSGQEVAYFSNNKLYVNDVQVLKNLIMGRYQWQIKPDSSMKLVWV